MRVLRTPEEARGYHLPSPGFVGIQDFLNRKDSGLRHVRLTIPLRRCRAVGAVPIEHSVAMWMGRLAHFFGVSRKWLLMTLQAEQGLIADPVPREAECAWRRVPSPRGAESGERAIRTRGGWIAARGDWKMMAACGYAIPDPGGETHFTVERYLGFVNQTYHLARWLRARADEYSHKTHPVVTLYGGEKVECGDQVAYCILRYTPNEAELEKRVRLYKELFTS